MGAMYILIANKKCSDIFLRKYLLHDKPLTWHAQPPLPLLNQNFYANLKTKINFQTGQLETKKTTIFIW